MAQHRRKNTGKKGSQHRRRHRVGDSGISSGHRRRHRLADPGRHGGYIPSFSSFLISAGGGAAEEIARVGIEKVYATPTSGTPTMIMAINLAKEAVATWASFLLALFMFKRNKINMIEWQSGTMGAWGKITTSEHITPVAKKLLGMSDLAVAPPKVPSGTRDLIHTGGKRISAGGVQRISAGQPGGIKRMRVGEGVTSDYLN